MFRALRLGQCKGGDVIGKQLQENLPPHTAAILRVIDSSRGISSSSSNESSGKVLVAEVTDDRVVDFTDVRKAFQTMSTGEILRGAVVYQFCSYKFLVDHSMGLFDFGKKYAHKALFEKIMKTSFYGHFATSDEPTEILKKASDLWKSGIGTSLAYAVEDDMSAQLDGESKYQEIFDETMTCITLAGKCDGETSVAIKLTAFLPPTVLFSFNELLDGMAEGPDVFDFDTIEKNLSQLSEDEQRHISVMMERVERLAEHSSLQQVRLIVDAEHTYYQTAIRNIAIQLMRKFNQSESVVLNTIQNYLKRSRGDLLADLDLSRREGFHLGVKMVRGAYMDHERERAEEMSYEDPIHNTYEDTNNNYNENVYTLMQDMKLNGKIAMVIASHNEETVHVAMDNMAKLGLDTSKNDITFAQLMGMCDHITYSLSTANYRVYKYVPYGPVVEVLPYLHRRAQENQAVLGGRADMEKKVYLKELRRRVTEV